MNVIKNIIQKEEFIALAVNKYILQNAKLPMKSDRSLDWSVLTNSEYLGANFNKRNPFTKEDIHAKFDKSNNLYLTGVLSDKKKYMKEENFLYSFYINRLFRVNTLPPKNKTKAELSKGSKVLYEKRVNEITKHLKNGTFVRLVGELCPSNNYFYELKDKKLTYKFCRGDYSIEVYQEPPILVENFDDLRYIKAKIGDKIYVQRNQNWYEYYYQGDLGVSWVPSESGSILHSQDEEQDIEDRIISYIPNSKDLVLRYDGGCMLSNGDIFCWGNNIHKKAGIESKGQLYSGYTPNYINTPVMLKVQIDNKTKVRDGSGISYSRNDKRWYNNPYRIKFEKMALNNNNVCAISPLFDFFQAGSFKKFGGDLYCNGKLNSKYFEDINDSVNVKVSTSILKRNKFFAQYKNDQTDDANQNEIYLKDVAMVDDTIAVLSEDGKIYTLGSNNKGALGINNTNQALIQNTPTAINAQGQVFKKLYALRDIKGFGALDEYNKFWIWGERANGQVLYVPTSVGEKRYDSRFVLTNSKDFVLRGFDRYFYRTYETSSVKKLNIPSDALSISIYDKGSQEQYIYIDSNRKMQGTSALLSCFDSNGRLCGNYNDWRVLWAALGELNDSNDEVGNFSNISIFELNNSKKVFFDDFENNADGWSNKTTTSTNSEFTKFLGRFAGTNGKESIYKTYDFGSSFANKDVKIEFDMYEIDSWDGEEFTFFINKKVERRVNLNWNVDNGGIALANNVFSSIKAEEIHTFSINTKLDSNGRVRVGFGSTLNQGINDESFGIDNVKLTAVDKKPKTAVCAMTGLGSSSQMYCWGSVGRALPLLSSSLYDEGSIDSMNKLFVSSNDDISKRMSFSEFDNSGKLYLKYPTYIGGFDYEFYFK